MTYRFFFFILCFLILSVFACDNPFGPNTVIQIVNQTPDKIYFAVFELELSRQIDFSPSTDPDNPLQIEVGRTAAVSLSEIPGYEDETDELEIWIWTLIARPGGEEFVVDKLQVDVVASQAGRVFVSDLEDD